MFEQSGKSLSEFCRENGLSESTLSLWRKQVREPATIEETFVEVDPPVSSASPAGSIMIRLREATLEVPIGTDPAWLADVVARLRPQS